MTIDEMIAVLEAAKEGKQIQSRPKQNHHMKPPQYHFDEPWVANNGDFAFDVREYRIKPEPREWEVPVDALEYAKTVAWTVTPENRIKVREVLE